MRKLSIRSRGNGAFEVGPAGHKNVHGFVPAVVVSAADKGQALVKGRAALLARDAAGNPGGLASAGRMSFRDHEGMHTRKA